MKLAPHGIGSQEENSRRSGEVFLEKVGFFSVRTTFLRKKTELKKIVDVYYKKIESGEIKRRTRGSETIESKHNKNWINKNVIFIIFNEMLGIKCKARIQKPIEREFSFENFLPRL